MKLVAVGRTCRLDMVTVAGGEKRLASQLGMVSAGDPSSVREVEGQPFSSKNKLFFFSICSLGIFSPSLFFLKKYTENIREALHKHGEYMESIRKIRLF